jgi:NitT/TauT family transport system substrate-binding protein
MAFSSRASFLVSLGVGAGALAVPRVGSAQSLVPLSIAGVFSDLFAEPFYAKDAGAFTKAGFAVDATSLNNAGAVAAAIGGGSLQMGTGDLVSGVNAILAGVPIVLLAGGGLYRERTDAATTILAVTGNSPIKTAADLAGKSIGVPTLVGLTTACLKSWLPANGVPVDQVKLVEIPQASALPAIQRGTLDVALLSEPFVTFAQGQVRSVGSPFNVAADKAKNKEFCVSVWYASKPWVDADPARAKRAVAAIYATASWANNNHDATFAILVRDGKLDADKAKGMARTTYATELTPEMVDPVLQIAMDNKMFPKPVQAAAVITRV